MLIYILNIYSRWVQFCEKDHHELLILTTKCVHWSNYDNEYIMYIMSLQHNLWNYWIFRTHFSFQYRVYLVLFITKHCQAPPTLSERSHLTDIANVQPCLLTSSYFKQNSTNFCFVTISCFEKLIMSVFIRYKVNMLCVIYRFTELQ